MMRVMLVPNGLYGDSVEQASLLDDGLDRRGVDVVYAPRWGDDRPADLDGVDLVVALGGDGTLLRAVHLVGSSQVPILGLSYGHLGFLTYDRGGRSPLEAVCSALAGELHQSRRAVLKAVLRGTDRDGAEKALTSYAINEVVLARGASGRMVEFDVGANGCPIDRLRGDGFVVATATGSTGYALSAGGPIVSPEYRGLVCVPVAPHTICARAFVTSPSDVVDLTVVADRSTDRCVFADGEPLAPDLVPLSLEASIADFDVVLLTGGAEAFYANVSRVFYGKLR